MTEPIDLGGGSPAPEATPLPDRLPTAGQSITACRALAAPVTVKVSVTAAAPLTEEIRLFTIMEPLLRRDLSLRPWLALAFA